jgi:hypothetical protein
MRALTLVADRQLVVADVPPPAPPGAGARMESRQVFGKIVVRF